MKAKPEDKRGIGALLYIFAVSVIFWALYYQIFTAYTLWTERHTDRTVASALDHVAWPTAWGLLQKVNTSPRQVDSVDDHLEPVVVNGHALKTIGPDPYFENLPKDQWPAPRRGPQTR